MTKHVLVRAALCALMVATPGLARAAPQRNGQVQGPERKALLDAARIPAARELGIPVTFVVQRLTRSGPWALLVAQMLDGHKRPIDFERTRLAELARHGVVSDGYAALLRQDSGGWRVVEHQVGPTDEGWRDWPADHGAPQSLLN